MLFSILSTVRLSYKGGILEKIPLFPKYYRIIQEKLAQAVSRTQKKPTEEGKMDFLSLDTFFAMG